nr:MAG TPA: hypothetical protein [Caudoviricetes sp.]
MRITFTRYARYRGSYTQIPYLSYFSYYIY